MLNPGFDICRSVVIFLIALCAMVMSASSQAGSAGDTALSDQRMATSPQELIKILSEAAYLKPEEYQAKWDAEVGETIHPFGLGALAQHLDEKTDPRRDIKAEDIKAAIDVLTGISLQSKHDGELLWGRIQGTKYERQASTGALIVVNDQDALFFVHLFLTF